MADRYPIVSADSNLQVASEHWTGHVPVRFRELAPRTVRVRARQDATVMGDSKPQIISGNVIEYFHLNPAAILAQKATLAAVHP